MADIHVHYEGTENHCNIMAHIGEKVKCQIC